MDSMLKQYLVTALWAETDNSDEGGGQPLDSNYDITDIDTESLQQAEKDCKLFIEKAGSLLNGLDMEQVGHDFWLTRKGHGAGFWDGDYEEEIGDKLTELAKEFKDIWIEVYDSKIYFR